MRTAGGLIEDRLLRHDAGVNTRLRLMLRSGVRQVRVNSSPRKCGVNDGDPSV